MPLRPCPSCGRDLSSQAKVCPHCGHVIYHAWSSRILTPTAALWIVTTLLGTFLLFGFLAYR